jgi:hypothetical protein
VDTTDVPSSASSKSEITKDTGGGRATALVTKEDPEAITEYIESRAIRRSRTRRRRYADKDFSPKKKVTDGPLGTV